MAFAFLANALSLPLVQAGQLDLPAGQAGLPLPGTMIQPSAPFSPAILKGLTIHPNDPLKFDFIVDTGSDVIPAKPPQAGGSQRSAGIQDTAFRQESEKLIKYFLASLTIPEDKMWVNLSPYEKDRQLCI